LSQRAAEIVAAQDAFAVLFFVSVGMLFDPLILAGAARSPGASWSSSLVSPAFAIVLLFRYPVGTALTVSASLAQIGEFSFILAALGIALNLLPPERRDSSWRALFWIALNHRILPSGAGAPAACKPPLRLERTRSLTARRLLRCRSAGQPSSSAMVEPARSCRSSERAVAQVIERDRPRFEALRPGVLAVGDTVPGCSSSPVARQTVDRRYS
jgi:Kef-type K+ transport system membrane component KefB